MAATIAHASLFAVAAAMLVAAGQPLFAEDTWLHLALGRAYAEHGPWLAADPLLHTAAGAPAPSAWLFDVALHAVAEVAGFQGLRVAHAIGVAAILALAWRLLRRASGSPTFASVGTSVFVALSAYRLFQLRPDLFTIFAALVLIGWLIGEAPPTWRKLAAIAALFALWANLHGGFVLGLALLGAAAAAHAVAAIADPRQRVVAARLAAALACATAATLVNPSLAQPHLLYFRAGADTPALAMVQDEWARLIPWELPVANVPPSPLVWAIVWALLIAAPIACALRLRSRRDAGLVALAVVSLVGIVSAVRLTWLGIAPLLLLGRLRGSGARRTAPALAAAAAALVPAFLVWGDWPMISRGIHPDLYGEPYPSGKYDAHAVWFLHDAGLEGRLYNDYASANFLGYWLAPRLTGFVNGSLNVPLEAMEAWGAIARRTGAGGARFGELLDRYGVDVFVGSGLPVVATERIPASTTTHLEGESGWVPVFRSPRSGVYLRRDERNAENLARAAAYYRRERVPFDPEVGFDPERVIERAPRWAAQHGIAPLGHRELALAASSFDPGLREPARDQLALLHALVGSYARAAALDRSARAPDSVFRLQWAQRRVWTLLHLRRDSEAAQAAHELTGTAEPGDALSALLSETARRHAELPADEALARVALLPLLWPADARRIMSGFVSAEARARRPRSPVDSRRPGPEASRGVHAGDSPPA